MRVCTTNFDHTVREAKEYKRIAAMSDDRHTCANVNIRYTWLERAMKHLCRRQEITSADFGQDEERYRPTP